MKGRHEIRYKISYDSYNKHIAKWRNNIKVIVCILGALAACHYIANRREKIFNVLYKALNSNSTDLQEVSHNCMKKVNSNVFSN